MSSRHFAGMVAVAMLLSNLTIAAAPGSALPIVEGVEAQPLAVQVNRLREALDYLGTPLSDAENARLDAALKQSDAEALSRGVQGVLDARCLFGVQISPESRVKVSPGPAKPELDQDGWRQFLVKVHNEAGVTAPLKAASPQAMPVPGAPAEQVRDRWLDLQVFAGRPLAPNLTGQVLEYRILQIYSRDAGKRSAVLAFNVGQGTQDTGFRNDVTVSFDVRKSQPTLLHVLDENGEPTTAGFIFRDKQGRVYPSQAKRLAPDFAFQPQVYRADGEAITLPQGEYTAEVGRGPEYVKETHRFTVGPTPEALTIKLQRWIDPSKMGWWSGDHHIHAAGCAHYTKPSEGVLAADMYRHCLGEDLKVGCNLTWGPCFDYQKQFFTGKIDKVSRPPYLLRYDIEVSGFGSHQSGHLCLLRLSEQIPPGGDSKNHWPTLCLNTLRWAKKQGAVCGPAHSGWGLQQNGNKLPTYEVPPYNGIGANEYVVDVTHTVEGPDGKQIPAVDFMSAVDTPYVWELNMWYHTLNCGYRTRISGETDFPCIYGERVGLGRSYVKLDGPINFDDWCDGIRQGRCYVSDGFSHLMEMQVNGLPLGTKGSELRLNAPGSVKVTLKAAARLDEQPNPSLRDRNYAQKPYWNVERARIGDSRNVPVEAIVNGYPVARQEIVADGTIRDLAFNVAIERSSWVAVRILPSSHTNPVFVVVDGKPIRPSRRSAEWCLKGVDVCWSQKERFIKADEMDDAKAAYAHARQSYRRIIDESFDDRAAVGE
jgi:hypothetical protein